MKILTQDGNLGYICLQIQKGYRKGYQPMHCPMPRVIDEKFFRCGSRKRYVKKLMSWGVPRNEANRAAKLVQILGFGYTGALMLEWKTGRWGFWMKQRTAGCGGFAV